MDLSPTAVLLCGTGVLLHACKLIVIGSGARSRAILYPGMSVSIQSQLAFSLALNVIKVETGHVR